MRASKKWDVNKRHMQTRTAEWKENNSKEKSKRKTRDDKKWSRIEGGWRERECVYM